MNPSQNRCTICPRHCRVNRMEENGFCQTEQGIVLSSALVHYGEEPVFSENSGVGNFFFTSCNLSCVYCQNYQISQERNGTIISEHALIEQMFAFQNDNCGCIGLVSPSHQAPWIRSAVKKAKNQGLKIPIIYNSAAYDDMDQLKAWEGLVDIYLPDIRYADDRIAHRYSNATNYVNISREALLEMYRQVGPVRWDSQGKRVLSGVWVRHLILPNGLAGSWETLCFLALELSPDVGLSIMSQYNPLYLAHQFPELFRCITRKEYNEVVDMAASLGFSNVLTQDLTSVHCGVPNFRQSDTPFQWDV
ncbi:MAG: 4Fe-4S cluster-binding domain-containing protein [Candidatus Magnetomorum sp.]|nr:4Fe-4S cluster-binding domain-containing protein [Candidatus Magnetomorum sp.]